MYSYEQRVNAVELLIQYDMSYSSVMRELGYPSSPESLRSKPLLTYVHEPVMLTK